MEAIIFCGIQASGKTSFYLERFLHTHVRISLDLFNTRRKELLFLETCLSLQQRFVVDNTNPTRKDRSIYILRAKERRFKVTGYYFQSVVADCIKRNAGRTGKAKIPVPGIYSTKKKLEEPSFDEGFDILYKVMLEDGVFNVSAFPAQAD